MFATWVEKIPRDLVFLVPRTSLESYGWGCQLELQVLVSDRDAARPVLLISKIHSWSRNLEAQDLLEYGDDVCRLDLNFWPIFCNWGVIYAPALGVVNNLHRLNIYFITGGPVLTVRNIHACTSLLLNLFLLHVPVTLLTQTHRSVLKDYRYGTIEFWLEQWQVVNNKKLKLCKQMAMHFIIIPNHPNHQIS